MIRFSSLNVRWAVDVEYDSNRDCARYGCGSICRCSRISSIQVKSANVGVDCVYVEEAYMDKAGKQRRRAATISDVERYCIDRLLRIYKTYDVDKYYVSTTSGYYGEEIGSISFNDERVLIADIDKMLNLKGDDWKIKLILEAEYSMLLDKLKDIKTVSIEKVDMTRLCMNDEYAMRLKREASTGYLFSEGVAQGVVLRQHDGSLRLIDGYHRYTALMADGVKVAEYIVVE